MRLRAAARQEHEKADDDGGEAGKGGGGAGESSNGGYDRGLLRWKIDEAVDRAGGRARAFLRRLWCVNSFSVESLEQQRRVLEMGWSCRSLPLEL